MNDKLKLYLKKIDSNAFGEPKSFSKSIEGSVCDTSSNWKDVVSIYLTLDEDKITSVNGKCGPCDPYAYSVLHGLMKILPGFSSNDITLTNQKIKDRFIKETGVGLDNEIVFHYETILRMIIDLLKE